MSDSMFSTEDFKKGINQKSEGLTLITPMDVTSSRYRTIHSIVRSWRAVGAGLATFEAGTERGLMKAGNTTWGYPRQ